MRARRSSDSFHLDFSFLRYTARVGKKPRALLIRRDELRRFLKGVPVNSPGIRLASPLTGSGSALQSLRTYSSVVCASSSTSVLPHPKIRVGSTGFAEVHLDHLFVGVAMHVRAASRMPRGHNFIR